MGLIALWAVASLVMALFLGAPTQATCWHGIGGALSDPHFWDDYCAAVDAEWQASLSILDRLLQWPALAVVLCLGGVAIIVARAAWMGRLPRPVAPKR